MTAATEGYIDAKTEQAVGIGEANLEKAINRLIRWMIAVFIASVGFGHLSPRSS